MKNKIKEVELLISQDNTLEAITKLLEFSTDYSVYDEILEISASYKRLEKDKRVSVISHQEYTLNRNIINNSLIKSLRQIEVEIVKVDESKSQMSEEINKIYFKNSYLAESQPTFPEFRYDNIFKFGSLKLPYVSLIGSWGANENEYRIGDVNINTIDFMYSPHKEFYSNPKLTEYEKSSVQIIEPKCRLVNFETQITPGSLSNILTFTFSKITYRDYLLTGQHIDDKLPNEMHITYRDKYANNINVWDAKNSLTSNICGVGIYIITRDNKLIITRQSTKVTVNPNTLGYSASGTMDWNKKLNIFEEIARECEEEIGHKLNMDSTYLVGFGLETRRLYYQFSFIEYSSLSSGQILRKAPLARDYRAEIKEIKAIEITPELIKNMSKENWEPISNFMLLTIYSKKFGYESLEKLLINDKESEEEYKESMLTEWAERAKRQGRLAVLSCRYPHKDLEIQSKKYINAVSLFLGDDVIGTNVLEIGCGIGLLSKYLVELAYSLHCIDISKEMIDRNKEYLGSQSISITYSNTFFQDFTIESPFDVTIVSLVLTHNTEDSSFEKFVKKLSRSANTIYLFEPLDINTQASQYAKPRKLSEIMNLLGDFQIERKQEYMLFMDKITFVKLTRKN